MATYLRLKQGGLLYKVVGMEEGVLTAVDPHTKERFKIPKATQTLKVCGYEVIRKKGESNDKS